MPRTEPREPPSRTRGTAQVDQGTGVRAMIEPEVKAQEAGDICPRRMLRQGPPATETAPTWLWRLITLWL